MELRWRAFQRFRWVWPAWERFYLRLHPMTPIEVGSLFAVTRRGSTLVLHLDSKALNRLRGQPGYSTFKALRRLRGDLAALAVQLRGGRYPGVTEIRAKTLLGKAGVVLGFHTRMAPRTLGNAFEQYFQVGLDAIYHPSGLRERAKRRWPVEIWMTVEELLDRYSGYVTHDLDAPLKS